MATSRVVSGSATREPVYDVVHLGRVELLTPDIDASADETNGTEEP